MSANNYVSVTVRIDRSDVKALGARAKVEGGRRSNHIRRAIRRYVHNDGPTISEALLSELVETRPELRAIGTNLNQLARLYNLYGVEGVPLSALEEVHEALITQFAEIQGTLMDIKEELERFTA